jgi:diacylglycerol kinase family enzyme
MRRRLPDGSHLPHPRIHTRTARSVVIRSVRRLPVEIDGEAAGRVSLLRATVRAGAYRLLV